MKAQCLSNGLFLAMFVGLLCGALAFSSVLRSEPVSVKGRVSVLSDGNLEGWQEKSFAGHTQYQPVAFGGGTVIKATSQGTASGLVKEITINLNKTPYLNWSWKAENRLRPLDETLKEADDYVARIYVVIDGGVFFWNTRALNYVWSANMAKEQSWSNAFAGDNAQMFALRTANDSLATWFMEKRNIQDDLERLFNRKFDEIHAVALMTDTDNRKAAATAYYGDIFFSEN